MCWTRFAGAARPFMLHRSFKRPWIGIDITHLAISLIERRLNDAFPGIAFDVHGTPKDLGGAQALAAQDKYQFQWWAVSLVNAIPYGVKKKGAVSGLTTPFISSRTAGPLRRPSFL